MTNPPAPVRKGRRQSASWWASAGTLVAIVGVVIAYAAWQYPRSPVDGPFGAPRSEGTSTTTSVAPSTGTTSTTSGPSTSASPRSGAAMFDPGALYLSDVPKTFFVRQPLNASRGAAAMSGQEYASSYSFRFSNCGNCTYEAEVNLPAAYTRFTGTVGLTDESRHDNTIDGIVYFALYSQTGALLFGPQKIEFPDRAPFEIDTVGVTRLRLSVTNGTNSEIACWCNAQFVK